MFVVVLAASSIQEMGKTFHCGQLIKLNNSRQSMFVEVLATLSIKEMGKKPFYYGQFEKR